MNNPDAPVPVPVSKTIPLPDHLQKLVNLLPMGVWVHRTTIETGYGKPEVKRRLRKIRSEYGWDIKSERRDAGANDDWYMRVSDGPVRPQRIRKEVRPAERKKVYQRDKWTCQMCGCDVSDGQHLTEPKCDHKVPAERGGEPVRANLQTLCNQCNLKKRQACSLCRLPSCSACPYAYPEQYAGTVVLKLDTDTATKLGELTRIQGVPALVVIKRLIQEA